jgi:hypothetical protein
LIFAYRFAPLLAYTISIYGAYFAFEEALCCWLGLLGMLPLESLGLALETLVAKQSNLV